MSCTSATCDLKARLRQIVFGVATAVCGAGLGPTRRARAEQVEAEIARLVGGDLRLRDGSDLRADVSVSGGPPWLADLTTLHAGRVGQRRLEAPSCQAAADAVALAIDAAAAGGQAATAAPPQVVLLPVSKPRPLHILAGVTSQLSIGGPIG